MKRRVKHLNTAKRRAWVWQDADGFIWFWSATRQGWVYLDYNEFGFFAADCVYDPVEVSWWDAPFKRLFKNPDFNTERTIRERPLDPQP